MKSIRRDRTSRSLLLAFGIAALVGCANKDLVSSSGSGDAATRALRAKIDTIVVIYAENRAFDNLYGNFPGAHGLSEVVDRDGRPLPAYIPQVDRNGSILPSLPPTWGGVTAPGITPVVTEAQSAGLPNAPFSIEHAFAAQSHVTLSTSTVTRDLVHRFFENQMQIDGGKNDGYAAWSDAGGLVMGHYDSSQSALYGLAKEFVLADNFFQGAFGGSFLNHQYLICACAPEYPNADTAPAKPSIAILDRDAAGKYLARLKQPSDAKLSALDAAPKFAKSGNVTPGNYFGDGRFYAVNTMQPAYQPSGNKPAATDTDYLHADPNNATTLPPQTQATIGDALDAKRVNWIWYSGSWDAALADGRRPPLKPREAIYAPATPGGNPDFQAHHQPFNYYERFDPVAHADQRAAHLKDYGALLADAAAGRLPAVTFYKPQGNLNQHAGYASVAEGDAHIAGLVATLRASPQWRHMVIVITYDEFGGAWDHVAPPKIDKWGPGLRVPTIIISPWAKRHFVDHTSYETVSILAFIEKRFGLKPLTARDAKANPLTNAFDFTHPPAP